MTNPDSPKLSAKQSDQIWGAANPWDDEETIEDNSTAKSATGTATEAEIGLITQFMPPNSQYSDSLHKALRSVVRVAPVSQKVFPRELETWEDYDRMTSDFKQQVTHNLAACEKRHTTASWQQLPKIPEPMLFETRTKLMKHAEKYPPPGAWRIVELTKTDGGYFIVSIQNQLFATVDNKLQRVKR
jgi:hypothetical protein